MMARFAILCITFLACFLDLPAQEPDVRIQRVFVQEADLPKVIGHLGDFVPIKTNELDHWLEMSQKKSQGDLAVPQLIEANLIAGLVGDDLVSDVSQISLRYTDDARSFLELAPWGLALRPIPNQVVLPDLGHTQSKIFVQPGGSVRLAVDDSRDYWFSWSLRASANRNGKQLGFDFRFPETPRCRLFLRLPPLWSVDAEDCIVNAISSPKQELGTQWPVSLPDTPREGEVWWKLEMSRCSAARIWLRRNEDSRTQKYTERVRFQSVDYRWNPTGLEVNSQWLTSDYSRSPAIEIPKNLFVKQITRNGIPVQWQQAGNLIQIQWPQDSDGGSSLIGSSAKEDSKEMVPWRLESVANLGLNWMDHEIELPRPILHETFVMQGSTTLEIQKPLKLERMTASTPWEVQSSSPENIQIAGPRWSGTQPVWNVKTNQPIPRYPAEVLAQIKPQSDSISATVAVRIPASDSPPTKIPYAIADGWVLENIVSLDPQVSVNRSNEEAPQGHGELVVLPPVPKREIAFEFQLRFQTNPNVENPLLPACRLIDLLHAEQDVAYVIERSGPFAVRPSMALIRDRVMEKRLKPWQQQRLPRMADTWIMHSPSGILPSIAFDQQQSTFSVELETRVSADGDAATVHHTVRCKPISGSMSRIRLNLSAVPPENAMWRQIQNRDGIESLLPKNTESSESSPTSIIFVLPSATSEPFTLEGSYTLPAKDRFHLPLVTVSDALRQTSKVSIESPFAPSFPENSVDVILAPNASAPNAPSIFAYDSSRMIPVSLVRRPLNPDSKPWIVREEIVDTVLPSSQLRHEFSWQIEGHFEHNLECQVPATWRCVQAWIDGYPVLPGQLLSNDSSGNIVQLTPPSQSHRTHQIRLTFDETTGKMGSHVRLDRVQPGCKILNSHRTLWLPEGWRLSTPLLAVPANGFSLDRWLRSRLPTNHVALVPELRHPSKDIDYLSKSWSSFDITPMIDWKEINEGDQPRKGEPLLLPLRSDSGSLAWIWFGAAMGLGLGWMKFGGRVSWRMWFLTSTLLVTFWTSDLIFEVARAIFMGFAFATICSALFAMIRLSQRESERNSTIRTPLAIVSNSKKATVTIAFLFGTFLNPSSSLGQFVATQPPSTPSTQTATTPNDKNPGSLTQDANPVSVVIPIDPAGNLKGPIVYIPRDFSKRVFQSPETEVSTPDNFRILACRHQMTLGQRDAFGKTGHELAMFYEINVIDPRVPIRFPLRVAQAELKKFYVNDSELGLGSKLRWDRREELLWIPEKEGRVKIRIVVEPIPQRADDQRSISIDTLIVANAQLELTAQPEFAAEIRIRSLGQITNPATGKYSANLGPVGAIELEWNQNARPPSKPLRASTSETWIDLRFREPTAVTQLEIPLGEFLSESFELEGPDDWQPIGSGWGSAKLVGIAASGSPGILRYRMAWQDVKQDKSMDESTNLVTVWWTPKNGNVNQLSVPQLNLVGVRPAQRWLNILGKSNPEWKIEVSESLVPVEFRKPSADFQFDGEFGKSYSELLNSPLKVLPFLRKDPVIPRRSYRCTQEIGISSSRCSLRWVGNWNGNGTDSSRPTILVPSLVAIDEVRVNGLSCEFLLNSIGPNGHQLIVANDRTTPLQTLELIAHFESPRDFVPLPFFAVEENDCLEYRVLAKKDLDVEAAFENLEWWRKNDTSMEEFDLNSRMQSALWSRFIPLDQINAPSMASETPKFRIQNLNKPQQGMMISSLNRTANAWSFRIDIELQQVEGLTCGAILEVPTSLMPGIQINAPHSLKNLVDANHSILFAAPEIKSGIGALQIQGAFSPSEGIGIPDIKLLNSDALTQYFVVPQSSGSSPLAWKESNMIRVEDASVLREVLARCDASADSLVYIRTGPKPQLTISNAITSEPSIRCPVIHHHVQVRGNQAMITSNYSIAPLHLRQLLLESPPDVEIVGVTLQQLPIQLTKGNIQAIDLFPSDLPVSMEVFSIQTLNPPGDSVEWILHPPHIEGLRPEAIYWTFDGESARMLPQDPELVRVNPEDLLEGILLNNLELLESASNFAEKERWVQATWFNGWQDILMREAIWMRQSTSQLDSEHALDHASRNQEIEKRIEKLQSQYGVPRPNMDASHPGHWNSTISCWAASSDRRQALSETLRLVPKHSPATSPSSWVATLVCLLALGLFTLRTKNVHAFYLYLENHPWILFALLASLAIVWLPFPWIGIIIAFFGLLQQCLTLLYAWQYRRQRRIR